jgi:hypothetical protein
MGYLGSIGNSDGICSRLTSDTVDLTFVGHGSKEAESKVAKSKKESWISGDVFHGTIL